VHSEKAERVEQRLEGAAQHGGAVPLPDRNMAGRTRTIEKSFQRAANQTGIRIPGSGDPFAVVLSDEDRLTLQQDNARRRNARKA
jgi:hypothetical protein